MKQSEFEYIWETKSKQFMQVYTTPPKGNASWNDFTRIRTLGKGAFGRVLLVLHKDSKQYQAMKVLSKLEVVKSHQIKSAINEKKILAAVNIDQITKLVYTFKDNSYLYLVMEFVPGGELFTLLRNRKHLSDEMVKFYGAQVLLAFEYLHYLTIAYRDLKPENLLLTADGYIKVADLGFAKMLPVDTRTWTVCGTPDYMAPEIVMNKGYGHAVDWWAFGIFLYELTAGFPPFMHQDQMKTFEHIISGKFKFTNQFGADIKDLIKNLLQTNLSKRFGNLKDGIMDIKGHAYFKDTDFMGIFNHTVKPPYTPTINNLADARNFEKIREEEFIIADKDKFANEFVDF